MDVRSCNADLPPPELPTSHLPPATPVSPMIRLAAASRLIALAACFAAGSIAWAGDPSESEDDAEHDEIARRTDPGADGPLNPGQRLPDLLSVRFSKWQATTPATDPFVGMASNGGIHLFRLDLEFEGVVNPPGPMYDSLDPESPFRYGPNPLIAFVEINVDRRAPGGGRPASAGPTERRNT